MSKEGKEKNSKKVPAMNLMEKRAAKEAKRNGKNNVNVPDTLSVQKNEKKNLKGTRNN
jgi:hypothetical protein